LTIRLGISKATADEFTRTVRGHIGDLKRAYKAIPPSMQDKVHSFLLESYLAVRRGNPTMGLETYLERFQEPMQSLQSDFGTTCIDDKWFDDERQSPGTLELAKSLSKKYVERRGRPKRDASASHDALLLRWAAYARQELKENAWVVTLDGSLVSYAAESKEAQRPRVITLDALLHWTTPICAGEADEDRLAELHAEAVRYQLLPRDRLLDLRDFQVLSEMEVETSQLPPEDVEACIREIRAAGPYLDPSKAEDREKIGRVIQRYFASPGTKFQKELQRLSGENATLSQSVDNERQMREEMQRTIAAMNKTLEERQREIEKLQEYLGTEQESNKEAQRRIAHVEDYIQKRDRQEAEKRLHRSVVLRCILVAVPLLLVWGCLSLASCKWGEGQTAFQKITKSWSWFAATFAGAVLVFPFVMGRERLRILKKWKGSDE